jgi:2-polyprenyl-3-methyl-5-hydroxy-6-metoxy-1,4-benzoquinol methylase
MRKITSIGLAVVSRKTTRYIEKGDHAIKNNKDYMPDCHYESLAKLETSYWWHLSRLNWAEKIVRTFYQAPSILNVVDYGCGAGGFLYELNKRVGFKSCIGIDVSQKAIFYAQKYGNNYIQCSPDDLSLMDDKELVLLMDVLEHIEEDESFLKNLLGQMKQSAGILISVPAMPYLFSSWDKALGHYRRYTKKGLNDIIKNAGGRVRYITYCFAYILPIVLVRRKLSKLKYGHHNCEFPQVHSSINWALLMLNRLELYGSRYAAYPFGNSLICLVEKNNNSGES